MGQALSELVIGCAMSVSRDLEHGFLERFYQAASAIGLDEFRVSCARQPGVVARYRGRIAGEYICDCIVDGRALLVSKAFATMSREQDPQIMDYRKATGLTAALLPSLGASKPGMRRGVHNRDDTRPT